jgi:hypothetical protein
MTQIKCSPRLWRRLGYTRQGPREAPREERVHGASLGSWGAALFRLEGNEFVIALNERTYLTLVFVVTSAGSFLGSFAGALTDALADMSISAGTAESEVAAIGTASLVRLTDLRMRDALADLEFYLGIELLYHDNLRRVQLNLNELPHANLDPHVPHHAVRRLLRET